MENKNVISADICILGGGPAGYVAAIRASQLGARVVLIEEKDLGGVCLNRGCIPTKALLKTAETVTAVRRSKEYGIESNMVHIDWQAALERKNRVVKNLQSGLKQLLDAKLVTILNGRGSVLSGHKITVQTDEETFEVNCDKLILATGAVPLLPSIKGIDLAGVITSNEALNLNPLPESLVIIGAGVIGLEFASMLNILGVKITILELRDRILPEADQEVADELQKLLKRQGISFKLSAKIKEIQKANQGLKVIFNMDDQESAILCEMVLVAVGRKINSDIFPNLPLQIEKGAVVVNEYMETSIPGVYAAGDLVDGMQLAHLAYMEGKAAAENAWGLKSQVNYQAIPMCLYTNPEAASVGMTEEEAIKAGIAIKIGRYHFRNNGRAQTLGEREGFAKVIATQDNIIIGGHILGANASEMISEITLAITLNAKANELADMAHPHPSMSEAIWEACGDLLGRAIHKR